MRHYTLGCQIDTSSAVSAQLRFYYHMYGVDMGTLSVDVFTSRALAWSTEFTRSGQQHKQELTLAHFSAQPEPFLAQKTP